MSKIVLTLFDFFDACGPARKMSKSVDNSSDTFWRFLTLFALREKCRKVSKKYIYIYIYIYIFFFFDTFRRFLTWPLPLWPFAVHWEHKDSFPRPPPARTPPSFRAFAAQNGILGPKKVGSLRIFWGSFFWNSLARGKKKKLKKIKIAPRKVICLCLFSRLFLEGLRKDRNQNNCWGRKWPQKILRADL